MEKKSFDFLIDSDFRKKSYLKCLYYSGFFIEPGLHPCFDIVGFPICDNRVRGFGRVKAFLGSLRGVLLENPHLIAVPVGCSGNNWLPIVVDWFSCIIKGSKSNNSGHMDKNCQNSENNRIHTISLNKACYLSTPKLFPRN